MPDDTEKIEMPGIGPGVVVKPKTSTAADFSVILEDGTAVKFKPEFIRAFRSDKFDVAGNPVYGFEVSVAVYGLEIPSNLKKKAE